MYMLFMNDIYQKKKKKGFHENYQAAADESKGAHGPDQPGPNPCLVHFGAPVLEKIIWAYLIFGLSLD